MLCSECFECLYDGAVEEFYIRTGIYELLKRGS